MTIHSVAQYTEGLNAQEKHYVNEFAAFMHERFPELNQKISFAMPMWLVNTKMKEGYVAVSAAKNHFSIHFSDEAIVARLANSLPGCKRGKRCINIRYGDDASFMTVKKEISSFLKIMREKGDQA